MEKMKMSKMNGNKMQQMDTGKMIYKDEDCDMEFDNKKDYEKHMKEYHAKGMAGKRGNW